MQENKPVEQLNKKEQWEIKKQIKTDLETASERKKRFKKWSKRIVVIFLILGAAGSLVWYIVSRPAIPEGEIISQNGLHWHANLAIYAKGVQQNIPADIGIGAVHMPIHTHSADGVIHMEMSGLVKRSDLTLDKFFKNWGKDFKDFGGKITMTVNGKGNAELGSYIMKDNDKIEIRYE